ncbi:nucleotide pyrophosphohydrolase [Candidatus Peregrinibacteria bacterium CG10_big_fil_rev_8_21_14_0_10_36_19]|nr:MAG: nucleotide pyrophosphohydrolase [Candidatus Peregrinibacteria bacterium CG10_big_fil_rev_8_21_14_0_10_36_19]
MSNKHTFEELLELAAKLRSDTGCPWDRKQTIASMLEHAEEEIHEVRQAIENGDHDNLKEELGDVLFQLVMIAQIAKEHEYFNMDDVIAGIHHKIISRHTWVFGDDKASTPEEALELWRLNKEKEKNVSPE